MTESSPFPPGVAMMVSIAAVSSASIIIRMSAAPPMAIASYRLILSSLLLAPFFIYSGGYKKVGKLGLKGAITLIGVGLALAAHFASWITSLTLTSVASSVIFVHIDPIFVALVSHFFYGERINRRILSGIILAFIGATIIAWGDISLGELNLMGDVLAITGGVMLGIYILAGRRIRQRLDLVSYVTPVYMVSAVALVLGSIASSTSLWPYPSEELILFLALAIIPMIFGHTVYNWALRYLSAPVVSISLLGEPVGASLLAFLILGEAPAPMSLFGGALTLLGITLCIFKD